MSESICNNIARTESNCGLLMNAMVSHMKEQVIKNFIALLSGLENLSNSKKKM